VATGRCFWTRSILDGGDLFCVLACGVGFFADAVSAGAQNKVAHVVVSIENCGVGGYRVFLARVAPGMSGEAARGHRATGAPSMG
jgi:hypothetical protein